MFYGRWPSLWLLCPLTDFKHLNNYLPYLAVIEDRANRITVHIAHREIQGYAREDALVQL